MEQSKVANQVQNEIEWCDWAYQTKHGFTLRGKSTRPRGKPLLHFIHGNSYSGLTYLPMWQVLSEDFDIFLHDAQGHGDSDNGDLFVGWNESARLAGEVIDQVVKPRFGSVPMFGCGHSFGGILTLLLSTQQPSLFNQLLLLDPILFSRRMLVALRVLRTLGLYTRNPYAQKARRRRSMWANAEDAYAGLLDRGMFRGWHPHALRAYVDLAMQATLNEQNGGEQWGLKCPPTREAEIFSSYADGLWPALTGDLATPTQIWVGKKTYPFARKALVRLQAMNSKVQLHWVEGGHCFMLEQPETTATQIRNTLKHAL